MDMDIVLRNFTEVPGFTDDYFKVRDFLMRIYEPNVLSTNWLWGRWEWMFSHPNLDETKLSRIGVWEHDGKVAAIANYEDCLGNIFFSCDRVYDYLKKEMLQYAADNLSSEGNLDFLICDSDDQFKRTAEERGFVPTEHKETLLMHTKDIDAEDIVLPKGYGIACLADSDDIYKYNRVLWKGFNHPGDAPVSAEDINGRKKLLSGPHLNPYLHVFVTAPDGEYASYCGIWYDPATDYAYVEPVATVPEHRRLGLGKAVVLENIRRCREMGAKQVYVISNQQFYYDIGFEKYLTSTWWSNQR